MHRSTRAKGRLAAVYAYMRQRSAHLLSPSARSVLRLAGPLSAFNLGQALFGLVDAKLVSPLGTEAIGGVGVANMALFLVVLSALGFARAFKICAAHRAGKGMGLPLTAYARVGLALLLTMGLIAGATLPLWTFGLLQLGVQASLGAPCYAYLLGRSFGMPANFALGGLLELQQGNGNVRLAMWTGVVGNILNAALAVWFINGGAGLPAMGVLGAGLASALTEWAQLLAVIATPSVYSQLTAPLAHARARYGRALREIWQLGMPLGLQMILEYLAFAACSLIIARISEVEVAAYQIVVVINRLSYLPGLAVGEAACILVGRALGAGQLRVADGYVSTCVRLSAGYLAAVGAVLFVAAGPVAAFFTEDMQLQEKTALALRVAVTYQVVEAINIVMRAALRAAKDVRVPAILSAGIIWLCVPPLTYWLALGHNLGAAGAWASFVAETALCALLFAWRYYRGAWRKAFASLQPAAPYSKG